MAGDQDGPRQGGARGFTLVGEPTSGDETPQPTPVNFTTFVLSLSTSALLHLGVAAPDELGGETCEINLPIARQTIEMLEMIRDKTRGNLSSDEGALLKHVLHDLRMRYVEVSSGHA